MLSSWVLTLGLGLGRPRERGSTHQWSTPPMHHGFLFRCGLWLLHYPRNLLKLRRPRAIGANERAKPRLLPRRKEERPRDFEELQMRESSMIRLHVHLHMYVWIHAYTPTNWLLVDLLLSAMLRVGLKLRLKTGTLPKQGLLV